jgi:hypothetical protein
LRRGNFENERRIEGEEEGRGDSESSRKKKRYGEKLRLKARE